MAALRNGSKCSHTTCMLRFFTVSRLALNTHLIIEIGSMVDTKYPDGHDTIKRMHIKYPCLY
jgi:hypothetical protein